MLQNWCGAREEGWVFPSSRSKTGHLATTATGFQVARASLDSRVVPYKHPGFHFQDPSRHPVTSRPSRFGAVIPYPGRGYVAQVLPPDADNPTVEQPVFVTANEARPSVVKAQKAVAAPSSRIVSWRRDQQPGKQFTTASETCTQFPLSESKSRSLN
jgi:hypothetical protein